MTMTELPFIAGYGAVRAELPGAELPWLEELRHAGLGRYESLGLPTPKVEEWKYTNLRPLTATGFSLSRAHAKAGDVDVPALVHDGATHRVVLVNGHVDGGLSRSG